ncbi:hypothetical protein CRUP_035410 [Coryphaenoides rupestris]|nr:hypothetical protein CRUP_035410 [Coryphaenoides rupestris]
MKIKMLKKHYTNNCSK